MSRSAGQRGQILVLFTLAVTVIIAMTGLVLDSGDAFWQRRNQQNGSDLAAVAGANAYLNTYSQTHSVTASSAAAVLAARAPATRNGYTAGTNGSSVSIGVGLMSSGIQVRVGISAPHSNTFSRMVPGQSQWTVSTEATAIAGSIDTAIGAAPWIMSIDAFPNGTVLYGPTNPTRFGETNGDYPTSPTDIAWTDYNGFNNVDSSEVNNIIDGTHIVTATFDWDQYVGQHNEGNHTALYERVDTELSGKSLPVPIVGPPTAPNTTCNGTPYMDGCFKGWALLHIISADGPLKYIYGYFEPSGFQRYPLTVGECTPEQAAANQCGIIELNAFGAYAVRLVD